MRTKHLIFVHGRSTKPTEKEKLRLVRSALLHGIERTDVDAARRLRSGNVRFTLAYFGDVTNRIARRSSEAGWKWMAVKDPDHGNALAEDGRYYDASLTECLARPTDAFTREDYRRWLREVPDTRALDDFARIASKIAGALRLSDELVRQGTPDMAAYLTRRTVASEIRTRLQEPLRDALLRGDDVCLLAHSMGCIVAYDVLWKFSRMSEYRRLRSRRVSLFFTMGNPLGEPGVRNNLYDAHEPDEGKYPKDIVEVWENVSAHDDFICHDAGIADDFREMKRRRYLRRLEDLPRIYTFWRGSGGANPHKLYAYLDHPDVGARIAEWIRDE